MTDQRLTPAAQEIVCLAGIQESFGKAAGRTLRKLAGLRLSESTVQRTTEAAGSAAGPALPCRRGVRRGSAVGLEPRCGGSTVCVCQSRRDRRDDARRRSGPGGRAHGLGWHDLQPATATADDEALSKPCDGVRYLAGLYTLDELGLQMRRQGAQVGMEAAEVWIALTDGGNGLEAFIDVNFPRAVKILDFHHARCIWRPSPRSFP